MEEGKFDQHAITEEGEQTILQHDISRLPPRVFRKIPAAIMALKKEIHDLLKEDSTGNAALKEVDLNDQAYKTYT